MYANKTKINYLAFFALTTAVVVYFYHHHRTCCSVASMWFGQFRLPPEKFEMPHDRLLSILSLCWKELWTHCLLDQPNSTRTRTECFWEQQLQSSDCLTFLFLYTCKKININIVLLAKSLDRRSHIVCIPKIWALFKMFLPLLGSFSFLLFTFYLFYLWSLVSRVRLYIVLKYRLKHF